MNYNNLTPDAIRTLQEYQKKIENGESVDPQIADALQAIDLASKVVNTIMAGNQIDPIFFKKLYESIENKFSKPEEKKSVKKAKKIKGIKKKYHQGSQEALDDE